MKKTLKIITIIIATCFILSCELDFAPENTMVDEIVYKDAATTEAALLGAYTRMNSLLSGAPTGVNNYASQGYVYRFAEVGTPTLTLRDNSAFSAMETAAYTQDDKDGYILIMYKTAYNAIDYVNNIIVKVEKYGDYDTELMKQHIAEAKFIRAYEYFVLLEIFGDGALIGEEDNLGVVIRNMPYEGYNPNEVQPRATIKETYEFIIADLKMALEYLPDGALNSLNSRAKASKVAANALLSRVYLSRGSFKGNEEYIRLAANYADAVIDNTQGVSFIEDANHYFTDMFPYNPTNKETNIQNFSNEVILLEPSYSKVQAYANGIGNSYFNKISYYVGDEFAALYEQEDVRGYIPVKADETPKSLIWQGSNTSNPKEKTTYKYNNGEGYNNVIYFRLSELLLTKAEAKARLEGINQASVDLLNQIRTRAYNAKIEPYKIGDFASKEELIATILEERLKELAYEGQTRFDFIRTGRNLNVANLPDNRKILPIPDYEIRISNGVVKQNSGFIN